MVDGDAVLSDVDNPTLANVTLGTFTGFLDSGQETLSIGGQSFTVGSVASGSIVIGGTQFGINATATAIQITAISGADIMTD